MTLGELVKKYRVEHELSLRDFSRLSGISNGYISMLEKNEHPKTKKPIVPSIEKMKCIASAMNMSLDSLLDIIDGDQEVSIKLEPAAISNVDKTILNKYHQLNDKGKQRLLERADELIELGYTIKGEGVKEA